MSLIKRVKDELQERRLKLLSGKVNCIPSPFIRFSRDFVGIEQHCYYLITSFSKGGKSQLGAYIFIFHPLLYAMQHPDKVRIKVLYFNLEENQERVVQRFMSYLLYKFKGLRYSPRDLRSTKCPVSSEILDLFDKDLKAFLEFFEENVIFSTTGNAYGIYKEVKTFMEERGTVHYKTYKKKNDFGTEEEIKQFDYYEPKDPDEYVIVFIDHIGIIDTEKGMSLKQSIDKLSEYLSKYLRNRYHCTPVVIQQQSIENEGLNARINNLDDVSISGLGDSKTTMRDINVLMTLSVPYRTKKSYYEGYDITRFKDNIRFLKLGLDRDGESGGICPLFFDGAVCNFEELPRPDDSQGLAKYYERMEKMRATKPSVTHHIIQSFKKLFKK